MPRFPKPWFRKNRRRWFVQIDRHQVNLGPNREAAFHRYHELMNRPKQPTFVPAETVLALIDAFLDWREKHRAEATYEWYRDRLQQFPRFIPHELHVTDLKPFHLQQWLDSEPAWNDGSKRNGIRNEDHFSLK